MAGKFASEHTVKLAKFQSSICTSYPPCVHHTTHRSQIFSDSLRTSDVLMHITFLPSFLKEIMSQHGNHQIRRDETTVFIHEHDAVCITVENDSDVSLCLSDKFLKIDNISRNQRIWLMIRETSVHVLIYICRLLTKYIFHEERCHSIGNIDRDLQTRPVSLVLKKERQIVLAHIDLMHLSPLLCNRAFATSLDPFLDLAKSSVISYRKSILTRHLHTVVLSRIVRSCDLYRGLETIKCSAEIHHRSSAQSCIIHICTCIGYTFEQILMNLVRRHSCISSYKHLVS